MLALVTAAALALLCVHCGVSGASLPRLDSMPDDSMSEDNSLESNSVLNFPPVRREWVKLSQELPLVMRRLPGASLELKCEALGTPAPIIHWLRDNVPITESDEYENNAIPETSNNEMAIVVSRLIINNILPVEKSTYTCLARSGMKTAYTSTNVYTMKGNYLKPQNISEYLMLNQEILSAPSKPRIVLYYDTLMETTGNTIILPCKAVGNPHPEIYWIDNNYNVISKKDPRKKVMMSGDLVIKGLKWDDMGEYSCVARNAFSKDTVSTFVYPLKGEN